MDEIYKLFHEQKYDEAKTKLKNKLKDDSNNAELLYKLFLAENNDYANMVDNDIKSEVSFNQAIQYAKPKNKKIYEFEYNFYRGLNNTYRKLFCYALRENVKELIDVAKNNDLSASNIDSGNLMQVFSYYKDMKLKSLCFHIVNIAYVENKDESLYKKLKEVETNINNNSSKMVFIDEDVKTIITTIEKEYGLYVPTKEELKAIEDEKKAEEKEQERLQREEEKLYKEREKLRNKEIRKEARYEKRHDPHRIERRRVRRRKIGRFLLHAFVFLLCISALCAFGFFGSKLIRLDGYDWPKHVWYAANTKWAFTDFVQIKSLMTLIGWLFQAIWFLFTWLLWAIIWVLLTILCGVLYALMYVGVPFIFAVLLMLGCTSLITFYYEGSMFDFDDVFDEIKWDKIVIWIVSFGALIWCWFINIV